MKAKSLLLFALTFSIFSNNYGYKDQHYQRARQGGKELDLRRTDLSKLNTETHNLTEARLYHALLCGANIENSDLSNANLCKVNFYQANLSKTIFINANLADAKLNRATIQQAVFYGADLTDADFSSNFLRPKGFWENVLRRIKLVWYLLNPQNKENSNKYKNRIRTNFEYTKCKRTNFEGINLIGANFKDAYLKDANFNNAILIDADFSNAASLKDANFKDAVLFGANFSNTNIEGAKVNGVSFLGVKGLSEEQRNYLIEQGAKDVYSEEELEADETTIKEYIQPLIQPIKEKLEQRSFENEEAELDDLLPLDEKDDKDNEKDDDDEQDKTGAEIEEVD